jgi:cytoskeletal protein CcmA (bactofilin family)
MFRDSTKKTREEPTPWARAEVTATTQIQQQPQQIQQEEPKPMATQRDTYAMSTTSSSSDLNALLGKGIEFEGKLAFEGMVRIDGKFTGQITTSDTLVIGEGARVSAEINCGTVVVHGEVNGNIRAKEGVELHKPAKVRGDIFAPSLMIDKGVIFQGQTKMEDLDKETGKVVSIKTNNDHSRAEQRAIRETTPIVSS